MAASIFTSAPIGFAFLDHDLTYLLVNPQMASWVGGSVGDLVGRTVGEVLGAAAPSVESLIRQVFATGKPAERQRVEHGLPTSAPGGEVWDLLIFPAFDPGGAIIGAGMIAEDVTARANERAELRRLYSRERQIADRLQVGLLPGTIDDIDRYELATRYVPGADVLLVGGDWFDVIRMSEDRVALAIGDVVGHGIDAALTMTRLRYALSGLCQATADPGRLLDGLDELVVPDGEGFVATIFLGVLELSSGRMEYSSAGHPPPILISAAGSAQPLQAAHSTPLGLVEGSRPTAKTALEGGDTLLLYTDGLFERRGEPIDAGLRRLRDEAATSVDDIEALADHLIESTSDPRHPDDIAVMIVRHRRESP